jgi:hypothetical protein
LDRVNDFLKNVSSKFANKDFCLIATQTELLDAFDKNETPVGFPVEDERIGFRNATFSWSNESDGSPTHSRQFQLKIDGEVIFRQGRINLVVGPTGSGEGPGLLCKFTLTFGDRENLSSHGTSG